MLLGAFFKKHYCILCHTIHLCLAKFKISVRLHIIQSVNALDRFRRSIFQKWSLERKSRVKEYSRYERNTQPAYYERCFPWNSRTAHLFTENQYNQHFIRMHINCVIIWWSVRWKISRKTDHWIKSISIGNRRRSAEIHSVFVTTCTYKEIYINNIFIDVQSLHTSQLQFLARLLVISSSCTSTL